METQAAVPFDPAPGSNPDGLPVSDALSRAAILLRESLDRADFAYSDDEAVGELLAAYRLDPISTPLKLRAVARPPGRPEAAAPPAPARPGPGGGRAASARTSAVRAVTALLTEALHLTAAQAGRDVRAATTVSGPAPTLPRLGAALAAGDVHRGHVDAATSTLTRLPRHHLHRVLPPSEVAGADTEPAAPPEPPTTGAELIDRAVTDLSRVSCPGTVNQWGKALLQVLDPDGAERFDRERAERRHGGFTTDFTGMGVWSFTLDPVDHALVAAAFERAASAVTRDDGAAVDEHGTPVELADRRTRGQRLADAFVAMAGQFRVAREGRSGDQTDEPAGSPATRSQAQPVRPIAAPR